VCKCVQTALRGERDEIERRTHLELFLLELSLDNFDFGELVELLVVASVVIFRRRARLRRVLMRVVFPRPDSP